MKSKIVIILLAIFIVSCVQNEKKNQSSTETPETGTKIKSSNKEVSDEINEVDEKVDSVKIEYLKPNGIEVGSWKDLRCGVCSRRCCKPCIADGDPDRCVHTKFSTCDV